MPRPTRAQGRPGTAVIPAGWEAGHRPVVAKTLTASIKLFPPGTTTRWDPDTGQNVIVTAGIPYYTDGARIQVLGQQARTVITAEDAEVVANYLVVVDAAVDTVAPGHLVEVTDSGDPSLDQLVLVVREVVHGSLRFERDLFCSLAT